MLKKILADSVKLWAPPEKLLIRSNGINYVKQANLGERKNLCLISRLAPEKKIDTLVSVFENYIRHKPNGMHWHLYGSGPSYFNIINQSDELQTNKLTFKPYVESPIETLQNYSINLGGLSYNSGIEGIATATRTVLYDFWESDSIFKYFDNISVILPLLNGFTLDNQSLVNKLSLITKTVDEIILLSMKNRSPLDHSSKYFIEWEYRIVEELRSILL